MTYLGFHLVFVLPCIGLLAWVSRMHSTAESRVVHRGILLMIALAVLYATPWDNWLVMEGIWTYPTEAVIARIGYVPLEEYLFFVLQPILTGLWLKTLFMRYRPRWTQSRSPVPWFAAALWGLAAIVSLGLLLFGGSSWRYLAMIGVWVSPILALQWAVGGAQLWANGRFWLLAVITPTIYLSVADWVAIQIGIWHITEATSTGWHILGLPIEEFLFFLTVNMMIVQGIFLLLWLWQTDRLRTLSQRLVPVLSPAIPTISDTTYRTLRRWVIRPGWVVIALSTLVFLLPVQVPLSVQLIPLVLSVVLLGLPHGAVDHLVPGLLARKPLDALQMTLLLILYLVFMAVVLGLWLLSPLLGFVFFILLTWWHWGFADLYTALVFHRGEFLDQPLSRLLAVVVYGGLPMLVPLLFSPQDYRLALESISALFIQTSTAPMEAVFGGQFRLIVGLSYAAVVAFTLAMSYRRAQQIRQMERWVVFAGEITLLGIYFAVVPPFLAIGLYFCMWHAARHIARLLLIDSETSDAVDGRRLVAAFGRFMKSAAPFTGLALLFLVALYLVIPSRPDDLLSLVGLYLVLISVLTLPHSVMVFWMDHIQGIWMPRETSVSLAQYTMPVLDEVTPGKRI